MLTPKQQKTPRWQFSTMATDALVLKHQDISIYIVDQMFIV